MHTAGTEWRPALSILAVAWLALAGPATAADAPGCRDPLGLKRFEGSTLVECAQRDFGELTIPTGKLVTFDYSSQKPNLAAKIDGEGRLASAIYFVPKGPSSAEVIRNYKASLTSTGFTALYEATGLELGADQGRLFENVGLGQQLFAYSPEQSRFLSAVKDEGGRKTYVSLYAVEYRGGVHARLKAEIGQVLVRLETVVSGALVDRMEIVTADDMERRISGSGRVTLYGILFDFNKAELKPQSRPALDEIAKYLKADPARRLHVVGHTDAVGGFEHNIRLSQARADAVVAELVRSYAIAPGRLKGNGVGLLAPIATNATDEGRAKNRRVELVPM